MALTEYSQYVATKPPSEYSNYGVPPAPLRTGENQKLAYWTDLLYLREWAQAICATSQYLYGSYTPTSPAQDYVMDCSSTPRLIMARTLLPSGTEVVQPDDGGSVGLKVPTANFRSVMKLLGDAVGGEYFRHGLLGSWWEGAMWIWPEYAEARMSKEVNTELLPSFYGAIETDSIALIVPNSLIPRILGFEYGITKDTGLNPGDFPDVFMSNAGRTIPCVEGFTEEHAKSISEIKAGVKPLSFNALLGMYEACRLFRYFVCRARVSTSAFQPRVRKREYSREYSTSLVNGGWKWMADDGLVLNGEDIDYAGIEFETGCDLYDGKDLSDGSRDGSATLITAPGTEPGYQCVGVNTETLSQQVVECEGGSLDPGYGKSPAIYHVLYGMRLSETYELVTNAARSGEYQTGAHYGVEDLSEPDDEYPHRYRVCTMSGTSNYAWRHYVSRCTHTQSAAMYEFDDDDIRFVFDTPVHDYTGGNTIIYRKGVPGPWAGGPYAAGEGDEGGASRISCACLIVAVELSVDSAGRPNGPPSPGRVEETAQPENLCTDPFSETKEHEWSISGSPGGAGYGTDISRRFAYVVPVKVRAEPEYVVVSRSEILETVRAKLSEDGISIELDDQGEVYDIVVSDKAPVAPPVKLGGTEHMGRVPSVQLKPGTPLESSHYEEGTATEGEDSDGDSCWKGLPGTYRLSARRSASVLIGLASELYFLCDWFPAVRVDPED